MQAAFFRQTRSSSPLSPGRHNVVAQLLHIQMPYMAHNFSCFSLPPSRYCTSARRFATHLLLLMLCQTSPISYLCHWHLQHNWSSPGRRKWMAISRYLKDTQDFISNVEQGWKKLILGNHVALWDRPECQGNCFYMPIELQTHRREQ